MARKKSGSDNGDIVTEIQVAGRRIGLTNDFLKSAILVLRKDMDNDHLQQYDRILRDLIRDGYKVQHLKLGKSGFRTTKQLYDVLEGL